VQRAKHWARADWKCFRLGSQGPSTSARSCCLAHSRARDAASVRWEKASWTSETSRSWPKSGLSEPLIDRRSPRCSPKEGILHITIFPLVGAPSRGGAARLVVLDREPEQLIGSPFDSCSRFIKSNSQSRARSRRSRPVWGAVQLRLTECH
jgi:hypothetical protein